MNYLTNVKYPMAMHAVVDALGGIASALAIPVDGAQPLKSVLAKHGPEALAKIVAELGTDTQHEGFIHE